MLALTASGASTTAHAALPGKLALTPMLMLKWTVLSAPTLWVARPLVPRALQVSCVRLVRRSQSPVMMAGRKGVWDRASLVQEASSVLSTAARSRPVMKGHTHQPVSWTAAYALLDTIARIPLRIWRSPVPPEGFLPATRPSAARARRAFSAMSTLGRAAPVALASTALPPWLLAPRAPLVMLAVIPANLLKRVAREAMLRGALRVALFVQEAHRVRTLLLLHVPLARTPTRASPLVCLVQRASCAMEQVPHLPLTRVRRVPTVLWDRRPLSPVRWGLIAVLQAKRASLIASPALLGTTVRMFPALSHLKRAPMGTCVLPGLPTPASSPALLGPTWMGLLRSQIAYPLQPA